MDTVLAQHFAHARVQTAFALDDDAFRADPAPRTVVPRISRPLAFCNLPAGATAENVTVIDAASQHGMSSGLGVVSVTDATLKTGVHTYLAGGGQRTARLQPYHARLAWLDKPTSVRRCERPTRGQLDGYPAIMTRTAPLRPGEVLAMHRDQVLRLVASRGASNVRVFGSVARGDDGPGSDIDLLVDFPPGTSLLTVISLEQELRDALGVAVDVGPTDGLRESVRERVLAEARPL